MCSFWDGFFFQTHSAINSTYRHCKLLNTVTEQDGLYPSEKKKMHLHGHKTRLERDSEIQLLKRASLFHRGERKS